MTGEADAAAQAQAPFILDPRHTAFVQGESDHLGDVRLTWFQRLFIGGLVLATLILAISALLDPLAPERVEVEARLDRREQLEVSGRTLYVLSYRYFDEFGNRYEVEDLQVSRRIFERTVGGQTVTVSYDPDDPAGALPVNPDAEREGLTQTLILLAVMIAAVVWTVVFWLLRPVTRNSRLEADGETIPAVLLNAWPRAATGRAFVLNVSYTFEAPDGRSVMGRDSHRREDLKFKTMPQTGTPLLVRYVNRRLYRLM